MLSKEYNKTQVVKYLIWAFVIAYILQIGAAFLYNSGDRVIWQMPVAAAMYAPALAVLLAGGKFRSMGWKPRIRKNIRPILIAWFAPLLLTAVGASLYFLIFPGHFVLTGEYMIASGAEEALSQMEAQGVSFLTYFLISIIGCITYAPAINVFVALGEEIGWRGFLYPQLKTRFGRKKGWILGGIIWGAWHWPLICLIGYEYGTATGNAKGYIGAPIVGMLLFCVITVGLGILHDRLYEKSRCIWVPAIFHGAVNAAGTLPLAVCRINTGSARLLGPAPVSIIAGLPFLAAAAVIFVRSGE